MIDDVAAQICAGIDNGKVCGDLCGTCRRQAEAAVYTVRIAEDVRMKGRIKALEGMLLEVLEIAKAHEDGEYIERAQDLLFDA
jgi:hypothetical protein